MSELLKEKSIKFNLTEIYKKKKRKDKIMQTIDALSIFLL